MGLLGYILIFILLLIILLIFSEVKIHILYKKDQNNDFMEVNLWFLYRLIHIKKKISLIDADAKDRGIKYKSSTNVNSVPKPETKKERITVEKIIDWNKKFKHLLKRVHNLKKEVNAFLKHVKIDLFIWESKIGTGDAMETGIVTGVVWGLKGYILGLVSKYTVVKSLPFLDVKPIFTNKIYHSRFECILRFRIGYLIVTGIRLIFKFYKGGRKVWQENILSKA
ncbi:hypothetical protein BHF71_03685 [Vulcanibacillus modesticaldus]|uniref:DUF2953 domain-containing protein n=1 Tax=Vulcanibacillus modesticaldus TaxID=337097 RepID=A0A1D2YSH8_9BACI|nr:DUF2953 domain-containing protein [Vulcanibacillus modesticaldus]OEF97248.1 hypothetical protein BHF71_03685 [Vulcanibacillus modesticaldus]